MNFLIKIFFFILILVSSNIKGQIFDSIIIKTHPLRDAVALNPNIGIEKILNKKFSLELELTYKTRDNEPSRDFDFWSYKKSNGFIMQTAIRKYFVRKKHIPCTWYLSGQLGYRFVNLTNFKVKERPDIKIVDINKKRVEVNIYFGKQTNIYKNLLTEINIGVGILWEIYHEKLLSGNDNGYRYNNGIYKSDYLGPNIFINWTIGYMITK